MGEIKLIITKHANNKMLWLGITEEQIRKTIQQGAKFKQTEGYLAKYAYISVAYKKIAGNEYKIKTVFVD
ncbi:hypothetical protein HZA96_01155 [Candidatus Woesearchaeota archaeon]|nr:hypothetical protein [Candidatus Woesearchaeota archaeon]